MYVIKLVTGDVITKAIPIYAVPFLGIIVLFVIDYALSIFFAFYVNKLRNKIRR